MVLGMKFLDLSLDSYVLTKNDVNAFNVVL